MSSISTRHLERQLRHTRMAWQQAQQELAELKSRTQAASAQAAALLDTMTTAILAEDQDHVVTLLNQRLCDLFGLANPPAYYLGQRSELLLQESRTKLHQHTAAEQQNARLIAEQERVSGMLLRLRNGMILQQDYLPVVQQGTTRLHIWSYEDVTERQQAQERVQELSRLAEQSPQPIIRFNRAAESQYANPAAAPVLEALYQPTEADCRQLIQREIARALASGEPRTVDKQLAGEFYLWTIAPLSEEEGANLYLTNITARRRAEAELMRSQLFTARINDTVPTIVFIYDLLTNTIQYCNRQSEVLLGYAPEEVLAMGSELGQRLLHPDDRLLALTKSPQRLVMQDGEVMSSEYRVQHRDGSWRWLSLKSTCFTRQPNGRVWQMVVSAADVTERRLTEEELRQSRLFVERITETTPNLIYIYDIEKEANVYCNQFIETVLGYTDQELQEMGDRMLEKIMPAPEAIRLRKHFEDVAGLADGQILHLEYSLYHRDGTLRWLRSSNTPFARDAQGRVTQVVGSGEDITRWKTADEQRRSATRRLAEQNRLFRQVIDTVPNLIYLKDARGNYVLANQATAALYCLTNEALLQTSARELQQRFPDLIRHRALDDQILSTQQDMDLEDTFTDARGNQRWFQILKRPFVLADGTVQVLGVDNDITALKQTELALQRAKEVAEQNAQARQTFLTNMSHEIRTPMNGIMGLAELLAKTSLTEQQHQYLHHIRYSAENLLVVINDILDMAQLGAGRVRVEAVPFELQEVVKASGQALQAKADEKGIRLRLELPSDGGSIWVLGDPYRLRQVLLNLLSNAIKFTQTGEVLLTCRWVSQATEAPRYQFSVEDTGIGISNGQLQQLFEPFTQASASTAREYGGSGLGLSISRGLVELLGGELTAESRLHQGSTFRFTLQFGSAAAPAPAPELTAPNYQALSGRRVLLTEDNRVNQFLMQAMLRGWGMVVDTASSGPEAVALFQQHAYDVVLMDIQMPGMDGVAATRLLREHPEPARAATPVVALTAHAMQGEAERYQAAGLNAYLSKPFRQEALFHLLQELLPPATTQTLSPEPPKSLPLNQPETSPEPADTAVYDLSSLRKFSNNDEAFIRRLAHLFISTTPPTLAELEQHLQERNLAQLGAAAHHLKSSVDGLHIEALRDVLRAIETAAYAPETASWNQLEQQVQVVRQTVDLAIRQLQQEFPD
ncbi:PAS domain S-box protein [Hymenobacter tenuis]